MHNDPVGHVDLWGLTASDGQTSGGIKGFFNDLKNAAKATFNLDFGQDYLRAAAKSLENKNYVEFAVYELAAAGEMTLDIGAAYLGAKAFGVAVDSLVAAVSSGSIESSVESVKQYNPINKGPLPDQIANTFRSGTYNEVTVEEELTLYRAYGGKATELGQFWTRVKPKGSLQAQIDLALKSEWGNTAEKISTITIPAGTTIYEGAAESQGGNLVGGINQIFIPVVDADWLVK